MIWICGGLAVVVVLVFVFALCKAASKPMF